MSINREKRLVLVLVAMLVLLLPSAASAKSNDSGQYGGPEDMTAEQTTSGQTLSGGEAASAASSASESAAAAPAREGQRRRQRRPRTAVVLLALPRGPAVFSSPSPNFPTLFGEVETCVGEVSVRTNRRGKGSFAEDLASPLPADHVVTATDTRGNTSEFSAAVGVQ